VSLRLISHALRAWPTPFGATLNASTPLFETDGTCIEMQIEKQLALVVSQVVDFARWRHEGNSRALTTPRQLEVAC
jgi:FMN reductase